jgi:biopolymer transport protein TolR
MPAIQRRRRLMGEINVVPYIDVMLVLLIIFMVTAPLLTQGVQVELPDANAKPIDPELLKDREPLVLSVDRDGRYFLNVGGDEDSPVTEAEIARRASAVIGRDPAMPVLVKADERVPYGSVVRAMVILQQAGATRIGFLTDPKAVEALEELERRR